MVSAYNFEIVWRESATNDAAQTSPLLREMGGFESDFDYVLNVFEVEASSSRSHNGNMFRGLYFITSTRMQMHLRNLFVECLRARV